MADSPSLRVRNLSVPGDRGRPILSVTSLDVAPGVALGVKGPSGAGKSTFLFALAGLASGASGEARWGDTDILALSSDARARFRDENIGLIFQDFLLFEEMDPNHNAALKAMFAKRSKRADLRQAAAAGLSRLGLTETSGRDVSTYSGGERQRVAVARSLSNDPMIMLADEPTASLHRDAADSLTADLLSDVRNRGRSLIVVSHDERLLKAMDRVIEISDGELKEAA